MGGYKWAFPRYEFSFFIYRCRSQWPIQLLLPVTNWSLNKVSLWMLNINSSSHSPTNLSALGLLYYQRQVTCKVEAQQRKFLLGTLQPKDINIAFFSSK